MSTYQDIKADCLARGQLWEDPEFPAEMNSVFYHQIPPFIFEWKRPKYLFKNPQFVAYCRYPFDVVEGHLGDNWLLSLFGLLYQYSGVFYHVVPPEQTFADNYAGIFKFRIWWCGKWKEVLVDDRLPAVNGKLAFLQPAYSEQLWPALLEKAYAKLHGSYEALKYVNTLDALAELTGGVTEYLDTCDLTDPAHLRELLQISSMVTARRLDAESMPVKHIEPGINYKINAVDKIKKGGNEHYRVQLEIPTSMDDSSQPARMIPREEINKSITTKRFSMPYEQFITTFSRFEMSHLDEYISKMDSCLAEKKFWQVKTHQGRWKTGVSAGGCRNNINLFHLNPQIQIAQSEESRIIVSLHQHSIMDPKVIGFSIYKCNEQFTKKAPPEFFQAMKSSYISDYTNSRQVTTTRMLLPRGFYLIVPTTYELRQEGKFTLRVYSSKSITMTALDNAPKMSRTVIVRAPLPVGFINSFAEYESQFAQLSDEHNTINAFELQELLEKCLPNDFIKSCATIETCRQIVLSMEKDDTGRITLSDFKDLICSLKQWQTVFRKHALNRLCVMAIEKFQDALGEVGFIVPERTLSILVIKYMRKDGMLRFGDFVSAVFLLYKGFTSEVGHQLLIL